MSSAGGVSVGKGIKNYFGSGSGPVKNVVCKLPKHVAAILREAGVWTGPTADSVIHASGLGAKTINIAQGYEKAYELAEAISGVGKKGLLHDVTDVTSKTTDLMSSGLDVATFVTEGAVLDTIKQASSSLLALGMACLTANQGMKLSKAYSMVSALDYAIEHRDDADGFALPEALRSTKKSEAEREAEDAGMAALVRRELSVDELREVRDAVATKRVNHWLKIAQWVSFLALGVIGVLSLVFAVSLSPWFALAASTSALVFSIVSGLHEHIAVAGAFKNMRREQIELAKEYAPKEAKAHLKAVEAWEAKAEESSLGGSRLAEDA